MSHSIFLAYAVGLSGPFGSRSAVLMHVASASLLYLSHCGIWTFLYKDIAAVRACGLSFWLSALCWSSCSQSCQMDHHLEMSKKNCEAQNARAARPCRSGEAGGLAHRLTPWWGSRDVPVWSDPRVGPVPSQTVRPAGLPSLVRGNCGRQEGGGYFAMVINLSVLVFRGSIVQSWACVSRGPGRTHAVRVQDRGLRGGQARKTT